MFHQRAFSSVQITQREFQLTEDFTAPKGALLMPSLIASSMQVGHFTVILYKPHDSTHICGRNFACIAGSCLQHSLSPHTKRMIYDMHCRPIRDQKFLTQTASAKIARRTLSSSATS